MNNKLNITWCYPDILNLHGDKGNIMALEKVGKLLDLDVNVTKVNNFNDLIDFDNTDILLLNSGEFCLIEYVINALNNQKKELKKYIDSGKVLIAIGTTGSVFANRIKRIDKGDLVGLEYLDMNCQERNKILKNDLIIKPYDYDKELIGNSVSVVDSYLNSDIAFADVIYGYGNNKQDKIDGARYNNLIFTNMIGPLFIKNPWFAEEIIKLAMKNKKVNIEKNIEDEDFEYEVKSYDEVKKYIEEK